LSANVNSNTVPALNVFDGGVFNFHLTSCTSPPFTLSDAIGVVVALVNLITNFVPFTILVRVGIFTSLAAVDDALSQTP
jgi:hypothetical protein